MQPTIIDSTQRAVQICCELLNSTIKGFPVALPVTAPPQVVAGILRSGAALMLTDISNDTFDIDPSILEQAKAEFGNGFIAMLYNPIQPATLALDAPSILLEDKQYTAYMGNHIFVINDLSFLNIKGASVVHEYEDQIDIIKRARDGVIGLDAKHPNEKLVMDTILQFMQTERHSNVSIKDLRNAGIAPLDRFVSGTGCVCMRVQDVRESVKLLQDQGIEAKPLFTPLHLIPEITARCKDKIKYPVAEKLAKTCVSLKLANFNDSQIDLIKKVCLHEGDMG